jgi:hypothetical protein
VSFVCCFLFLFPFVSFSVLFFLDFRYIEGPKCFEAGFSILQSNVLKLSKSSTAQASVKSSTISVQSEITVMEGNNGNDNKATVTATVVDLPSDQTENIAIPYIVNDSDDISNGIIEGSGDAEVFNGDDQMEKVESEENQNDESVSPPSDSSSSASFSSESDSATSEEDEYNDDNNDNDQMDSEEVASIRETAANKGESHVQSAVNSDANGDSPIDSNSETLANPITDSSFNLLSENLEDDDRYFAAEEDYSFQNSCSKLKTVPLTKRNLRNVQLEPSKERMLSKKELEVSDDGSMYWEADNSAHSEEPITVSSENKHKDRATRFSSGVVDYAKEEIRTYELLFRAERLLMRY